MHDLVRDWLCIQKVKVSQARKWVSDRKQTPHVLSHFTIIIIIIIIIIITQLAQPYAA